MPRGIVSWWRELFHSIFSTSSPDIKTELKKKDDEFVKTLKRQAEDIDTLLQYMSRQFVEMQSAYKDEIEEIENAFLQERSDLLNSNRSEIQELFDKRSKMEQVRGRG